MGKISKSDDCKDLSITQLPPLTCLKGSRRAIQYPEEVWVHLPVRFLGYRLPGASVSHLFRLAVFARLISLPYTRGYECLAVDHDDSGPSEPDRSLHVLLQNSRTHSRWAPGFIMCMHMPR